MNLLVAMPDLSSPGVWISLLTLTFLEIVLGVDNIIFISIVAGKLPKEEQKKARNIGLTMAMVFRILLLLGINWIIGMKDPVIHIPFINEEGQPLGLSIKDLILIAGGIFLIVKSTLEIHHKLQAVEDHGSGKAKAGAALSSVIVQIILVDAVFSFDSILTAIGLVDEVAIMIAAVIISMGIMMAFSGPVSRIINAQPTLQMLALSFLVVIGVMLVAGGIHEEISKGIIYSCLAFSLVVEMLNIRLRKKKSYVELHDNKIDDEVMNKK
ncbi:MAG: TerC family protein [Sphingobacteriales bacterium]|nr:MAG: TerC family protein [Sphingobacteriales bacterium]